LPGEEVNIKTIIRKWEDLGIPEGDNKFTLKVNNSK
jgi:hypothetical protein